MWREARPLRTCIPGSCQRCATWSAWLHRCTVGRLLAVRLWAKPELSQSVPILGRPLAIRPGLDWASCQPSPATTALLVRPGFNRALRLRITGSLFTLMYVRISYCVIRTYVSANRLPVIRTYVSANIISPCLYSISHPCYTARAPLHADGRRSGAQQGNSPPLWDGGSTISAIFIPQSIPYSACVFRI